MSIGPREALEAFRLMCEAEREREKREPAPRRPVGAAEIGDMWLRERAASLRSMAKDVESAYTQEPFRSECARVAKAYRDAANVLEAARR